MRHGLCILPEHDPVTARERWQRAEVLGFDHAWTYDHLAWGGLPDSPWHSTVVTLTAAALWTERIGLGTFVASPNFRHPAAFTRDVVSLDRFSDGRFLLGLGAGGDLDAGILGEDWTRGQRTARFREFVEALDVLLTATGEPSEDNPAGAARVDLDGPFFPARQARNAPGCVQTPRVPFVVAGNAPRSVGLAVEHGQAWLTTGKAGTAADGVTDRDGIERWWDGVAELSRLVDDTLGDASRTAPLDRHLSLDACGATALSSIGFLQDQIGRATELGFTDVVVHEPRPTEPYRADDLVLEEFAATMSG